MTEVPIGPTTCISRNGEKYSIEIELPDVAKRDIDIEVTRSSIYITVPKYGSEFGPTVDLDRDIDPQKVEATFENGLLKIKAPLKDSLKRKTVKIK